MPFTSDRAKALANSRKRDSKGHFIKSARIKAKTFVDSPASVPINPEFEKPLVQVSITNPLKKILYWLDQIRRRQTTTFAIKLSIPLIALPVVILGIFSLGRIYGINFQKSQTVLPAGQPSPIPTPQPPIQISKAGILKVAKSQTKTTYLLALKNGELLTLSVPPTIDLSKYGNKQVLITGNYDKTKGILTVTDIAEIEIYNTTAIATSSAN